MSAPALTFPLPEELHWAPQPGPQEALLACPVEDVMIGGARGGGKSDGLLGDWISHADEYGPHARGIFFRRSYPELEEIERRALELFPPLGARLNVQRRTWVWPNGATIRLRYLKRDTDWQFFQGHSYTALYADELTQWPSPLPLDKLRATLRSPHGVPCIFRGSANPGGPGHNWVKARYIDPAPPYVPHYDAEMHCWRVFIPARLDDNPALTDHDPHYWERVEAAASGRPDLLKAWRWGIWDIVAGGMFDDLWSAVSHVIAPFEVPASWYIDRSFDWGSSHPFSVCWWAESDGTTAPNGRTYPRGSLFLIGEWYGWDGKPNEGSKMLAVDIGKGIVEREKQMGLATRVRPGPADSSIYDVVNGVCIADDMSRHSCRWERANKSPGSRKTGWERVRMYLKHAKENPLEESGLYVFEHCRQFIRTVPVLPRDERDPDDVDSASEDHIGDALRYRLLARKREVREQKLVGV